MTSVEEGEAPPAEEVPAGNPEDIAKNPTALKGTGPKYFTIKLFYFCNSLKKTTTYPSTDLLQH